MKKPNIIFLHLDQMRADAISSLGNKYVKTPNIDKLMLDGTSFMNSYSSNPICCPARTCWYTSCPSSENGVLSNGTFNLQNDIPDLGQIMSKEYECVYAGKWHVTGRKVFESFKYINAGTHVGELSDESVCLSGRAFLEGYKGDKPFFLNLGLLNPHDCCYMNLGIKTPLKLGFEDSTCFDKNNLPPLPENFNKEVFKKKLNMRNWTDDNIRMYIWNYMRLVETVDIQIGLMYDALKNSKYADNTYFILSADHGEMAAEHGYTHKNHEYDGALKVPLIISGKNVLKNCRNNSWQVVGYDVGKTILDLCGISSPKTMRHAESFAQALTNKDAKQERRYAVSEIYYAFGKSYSRVLNDENFKFVFDFTNKKLSVYYKSKDPLELKNVAKEAYAQSAIKEASEWSLNWAKQISLCESMKEHGHDKIFYGTEFDPN